ncbi:MAG: hypothetical protein WD276_09375 [Actinomycetota bacterium]
MHARVSTYQGSAESIERSIEQGEELLPVIRSMDGSRGFFFLVDRGSGKSISITLWETESAMKASEEAANRLRRDSAEASGESITGVERYEVAEIQVDQA